MVQSNLSIPKGNFFCVKSEQTYLLAGVCPTSKYTIFRYYISDKPSGQRGPNIYSSNPDGPVIVPEITETYLTAQI